MISKYRDARAAGVESPPVNLLIAMYDVRRGNKTGPVQSLGAL